MRTKDVTQALSNMNWTTKTDEVGDKVAYLSLEDRYIQVIYRIRQFRSDQQLEVMHSLSTKEFSSADEKICNESSLFSNLIVPFKDICIRVPEVKENHVQQALADVVLWAQKQDIIKALLEHAEKPTDVPGTGPVLHLAALAVLGKVSKLKFYQKSFESDDRLGFVPYITKDYIDRAVVLAEKNAETFQR